RVVVESAVCSDCHARAAIFHRCIPDREPTLAAELYWREQVIPAAGPGGFHSRAGAARDPGRGAVRAAHEADLACVFRSRDAQPMAALRALADTARRVYRARRRGLLVQSTIWPGHERCNRLCPAIAAAPGQVRCRGLASAAGFLRRTGAFSAN